MRPERWLARAFTKTIVTDDGCWLWTGKWDPNTGYGRVRVGQSQVGVHRKVYEVAVGPIPPGLQIDHLCGRRLCIRPDHLRPATPKSNTLRNSGPTAVNAAKDRCSHGHPFTPENTYGRPDGGRDCRTCRAEATRRHRAKAARR
jgi:hypothetical protein